MTAEWTSPKVIEAINRLTYYWADYELLVEADRITDAGQAELWFYHSNGTGNALFHIAKANLLASSTIASLVKYLTTEHSDSVPWRQALTFITKTAMEYQRRGEPSAVLQPVSAEALKPTYYIDPLIIKGVPNVIFGDKGVNKTSLGLTMLGLLANGIADSPCGLVAKNPANVAMVDWEATQELTNYTLARLIEGKTFPYFELNYLRGKWTLPDDIERIANFLHDCHAEVVLIDSLGQAAGSDKFDSSGKASALKFFECLRQLNITSVIIGQTTKDEKTKHTIYGSTYFTYYSRNIFLLNAKADELNQNQAHLALFHQEANYSRKHPPIGLCVNYTDTTIQIDHEAVSVSQFIEKVSRTKALLDFLQDGAKSVSTISNALGLSDSQIRVLLSQLKKRELVTNVGTGLWGLRSEKERTNC